MTLTQTDKNILQMEAYHDELMRELAKQSKRVHRSDISNDASLVSKGLFDTSKAKSNALFYKSTSSK